MSKSCTLSAHVYNPKGEIVESRLFNDLLHYTSNRELAKEYYKVGTAEEFLSEIRDSEGFETDENGEITFASLKFFTKMDLDMDKLIQVLNKDIGAGEYSYDEATRKVEEFNNSTPLSDRVMATMVNSGKGNYYVSVVPIRKTTINQKGKRVKVDTEREEREKLHKVVRDQEVEERIKSLLRQHHVSVKFIEDEKEGGRYSTEGAVKMERGLWGLIEVNETGNVSASLAEEAGHFAFGALGDNPLVTRLEGLLENTEVQQEALGEEYGKTVLGKNPKREIAGKLVGDALMRRLSNNAPFKILANRIANLARRLFYGFTGNEVRWAVAKAEQKADRIAYKFIAKTKDFSVQNALQRQETMYKEDKTVNQQAYADIADEFGRMCKKLEAIANDNLSKEMQAAFAYTLAAGSDNRSGESALQATRLRADALAIDGVVAAFTQLNEYMGMDKKVHKLIESVNLDNHADFYANMSRNGRSLRQARVLLRSADIMIRTLQEVLSPNHVGGTLTFANGSTIHDVRYQDENGTWRTIDLGKMLNDCASFIERAKGELKNKEIQYFIRLCEDVYGSKYITYTTGILWRDVFSKKEVDEDAAFGEKKVTFENAVTGKDTEDIDMFHRYLGSMANNPDIVGQIADKMVKAANKTADDQALNYQEQLLILKGRAEKLGLKISDLMERDEDGLPTGNLITPPMAPTQQGNAEQDFIYNAYVEEYGYAPTVHHGSWEKEKQEERRRLWKAFKEDKRFKDLVGFKKGFEWNRYLRDGMKKWHIQNGNSVKVTVTDETGNVEYIKYVPSIKYQTDDWKNLQDKYPDKDGDSVRQWVHDYMKIKSKLDNMLPPGATVSYRLPQFRGTFSSSLRNQGLMEKGWFKKVKAWKNVVGRRVILESFVETSEDYDYGGADDLTEEDKEIYEELTHVNDALLGERLNYENERVAKLPMFGINKLKNMQDLSEDLLGSMCAYASMATSYACMDAIIDGLEVGRQTLYERDIKGYDNIGDKAGRKLVAFGNKFRKHSGVHELFEEGSKNRAYGRYLKYMRHQVYGIGADPISFPIWKGKRAIIGKVFQNLSSLGGFMFLQGNMLGGMVNTTTGAVNILKDAIVAEDFTVKDLTFAHGYYYKHFPQMWLMDIGKLRKENKLGLFLTKMNTQGNNRDKLRNWRTTRSGINNFFRMCGYLPYSAGDHYMQAMSYLSVAHGTRLYDETGKDKTNLWNAYKRVDNTDEFGNNPTGHTLEFERLCPLDAKEITMEHIQKKGVYLTAVEKTTTEYDRWLIFNYPEFADAVYMKDHKEDYINYREKFQNASKNELAKYKARKYNILLGLLEKVENCINNPSPLLTPTFTQEELDFIKSYNALNVGHKPTIGTGNYVDIAQVVRDEIFNMIWTKNSESAYMDKCRELNDRFHGIYNRQDKTAFHQSVYMNAVMSMKGWVLGYLEMMYSPAHYSLTLGREVQGFMSTAAIIPLHTLLASFTGANHLNWKDLLLTMTIPWHSRSKKAMLEAGFSEEQNYNARRFEIAWIICVLLMGIAASVAPPDDEEKEMLKLLGDTYGIDTEEDALTQLIYYLTMRELLEQAAFLWVPEVITQGQQAANLLPVGLQAGYDLLVLLKEGGEALLDLPGARYEKDDPNGRYAKDDYKFFTHLERLIPYQKSWWGLFHGYAAYKNFEFGRRLKNR